MSDKPIQHRNRPSDEASAAQLALARKQGDAFGRALQAMSEMDSHGRLQRAGDYLIGYEEVEEAEGMYVPDGDGLRWREPQRENTHLEVVVRDADDGRFIPGLHVHATLLDGDKEVSSHELPFLWHPWLFHYGRNLQVPGEGAYSLGIRIDPPGFPRHDKVNGNRYAQPVDVWFDNVKVETGQKHAP